MSSRASDLSLAAQNPYRHRSIDNTAQEIRLIRLLPSKEPRATRESIRCEISHHYLDVGTAEKPIYTAISYTWSKVETGHHILINDSPYYIQGNLFQLLCAMCEAEDINRYLWIDQLCIDQTLLAERNHQVGLMSQIYSDAEQVYVWLGPPTPRSELGIDLLNHFHSCCIALGAERPVNSFEFPEIWHSIIESWFGDRPETKRAIIEALLDILARPYWERIWIVQELILANGITLLIGTLRCVFRRAILGALDIFHQLYRWMIACADTLNGLDMDSNDWYDTSERTRLAASVLSYRAINLGPDFRLGNALAIASGRKCTDPRDRVFGLQGIVKPDQRLTPDYSLGVDEIYRYAEQAVRNGGVQAYTESMLSSLHQEMGVSTSHVSLSDKN